MQNTKIKSPHTGNHGYKWGIFRKDDEVYCFKRFLLPVIFYTIAKFKII